MVDSYSFIKQEFRNISEDNVRKVCKQAEKVITESRLDDNVTEHVEDLIKITTLLSKQRLKRDETEAILQKMFSDQEVASVVMTWYRSVAARLSSVMTRDMGHSHGQYFRDLDWRLQATLASRSLLQKCEPKVTIYYR